MNNVSNIISKFYKGIWVISIFFLMNTILYASPTVQIFEIEPEILIDENSETKRLPVDVSNSQGGMVTLTCESSNIDLVSHSSFYLDYSNSHIVTKELLPPPKSSTFLPLVIIPVQNRYGRTTITLKIEDTNKDVDTLSFDLIVNGKPRISPITNYTISNLKPYNIDLEIFDPETAIESLDFSIISSLPDILPEENISLTFPNQNSNARLRLTPLKGKNGVVQITLQVSDQRLVAQESFIVDIQNLPVLTLPTQWTIPLNTDSVSIPMSICDADGGNLTLSIQSTDTEILHNENISIESSLSNSFYLTLDNNSCKSLLFFVQPQKNRMGDVVLKFIMDNGLIEETKEMTLTIINTAPQMSDIQSQVINMNTAFEPVSFSITDAEGGWITLTCFTDDLIVSSFCSQQGTYTRFYLDADEIHYYSKSLFPSPDAFGHSEMTIHITDGLLSESISFSLIVNDPPVIIRPDSQIVNKNSLASPISISVVDRDTSFENLSVSFDIPCDTLFQHDDIDYIITANSCTLLVTPITNQAGFCQISVNVSDGIGMNVMPIDIRVNDRPFIQPILPQHSDEDQPLTITMQAFDDDALNIHQWDLVFSNPQLVSSYDIQPQIESQSVLLILYPAADMPGQTTVTVKMTDSNDLSYSRSFLWQVKSVDDLPEISGLLSEYRVEENSSLTITIQLIDIDSPSHEIDVSVNQSHSDVLPIAIHTQSLDNTRIIHLSPAANHSGETEMVFKVFNIDNHQASYRLYPVHLIVYPENAPPVITSTNELYMNEDSVLNDTITGSDTEQNQLQFIIAQAPSKGRIIHFDSDSGQFTYVPFENTYGLDHMVVKAYDGIDYSDPAYLTITVSPVNDAPIAYDDKYIILANQNISIDLQAFDRDSPNIEFRLFNETITFGQLDLIDASNGIVEYSPPKDKIGQDHIWFFAKDLSGLKSNIGTITIRIENQLTPEYTLTVNMAGEYKNNDDYEYAILDAHTSEELISGSSHEDQFLESLHEGIYQLIIIAKGYEPYEYSLNNNRTFEINDQTEITCHLKSNDEFKPYEPSVQVSNTSIKDGFVLRVDKENFDDQFLMKINNQVINTGEESWPYLYTWKVDSSPFTISSTVAPYSTNQYRIDFEFYNWETYVDKYSVTYYDHQTDESKKFYRSEDRVAFEKAFGSGGAYGTSALYETEGYSYFYPLMGNTISLRIQSGTGTYTDALINIPRIPLNYLIIDDPENWEYNEETDYYDVYQKKAFVLEPSDRLKVIYRHYAFFMTIASGIAIEFEVAEGPNAGKKVRYNPFLDQGLEGESQYERLSQAPRISVPILLNSNYNKFNEFSEALLELMDTFPALVNEKGDGAILEPEVEKFQRVYMPFILRDQIIVYLQANHLTRFAALWSIPVDNNDVGHQYFHAESIDDGGCFIQGLLFQQFFNQ